MRLPFRCDSPAMKRWMETELSSAGDGDVQLTTHIVRTERRAPVVFLDSHPSGSCAETLNCCGWCNAVQAGAAPWQELEDLLAARLGWPGREDSVQVHHGPCPRCDETLQKAST